MRNKRGAWETGRGEWQRSLLPAPVPAQGCSLRAGGSETPESQGTAVPCLNTSIPGGYW